MIVNYKYLFNDLDQFISWLVIIGFVRYEQCMPCKRGYLKDSIDVQISYYSHIKNCLVIDGDSIYFDDPNEIPQNIIRKIIS